MNTCGLTIGGARIHCNIGPVVDNNLTGRDELLLLLADTANTLFANAAPDVANSCRRLFGKDYVLRVAFLLIAFKDLREVRCFVVLRVAFLSLDGVLCAHHARVTRCSHVAESRRSLNDVLAGNDNLDSGDFIGLHASRVGKAIARHFGGGVIEHFPISVTRAVRSRSLIGFVSLGDVHLGIREDVFDVDLALVAYLNGGNVGVSGSDDSLHAGLPH